MRIDSIDYTVAERGALAHTAAVSPCCAVCVGSSPRAKSEAMHDEEVL